MSPTTTPRKGDENKAKKYLIARANLFLLLAILLIYFFLFIQNSIPVEKRIFFIIVIALLIFGAVITYAAIFTNSSNEKIETSMDNKYVCKYCGQTFKSEWAKDRHERSCPKMKI